MVRLYDYWRSSASYRVRIGLNLAGIAYEAVPVDLVAGDQRGADHMARNPQGLVPVLEIDGHSLTQSLAILEYLNDTRALGWLPAAPASRAKARALAMSIAVDLHPVCNLRVARHAAGLSGEEGALEAWMRHHIRPGLEAFEALAEGFHEGLFATGPKPGLADLCLIPQLYNADRYGVAYDDLPRICAIKAACDALPAFQDAYPTQP
ncbi:MAG: maleylacetoacetate isomerase [Rhodobacterales bacterium]|nr:MAG: maleylacetoacetate isomerase [Rhodobacterales bacterium]